MNRIRAAIISSTFLLATGAFALQYPAGSQNTAPPSQPPQGSTQRDQPTQAPPSQNQDATQPGQQPSAKPPNSAPPGHGPSIDDQVQILSEQLNLTPDQQAKVKTALEDQHQQAMGIILDNAMPREDKVQKIHALRENTITRVRASLNDEQKVKFDQMIQQQDQRMHQQQPSQPPPAQQPPPK